MVGNLKGWNFATTAREVEQLAGTASAGSPSPNSSEEDKLRALRRVWSEAKALQPGDEAMHYLAGRGLVLDVPSAALRLHPGMAYRDGADVLGRFPVLLALVTGPDGRGATLHRTYLQDGRKAPVPSSKKLMPGKLIKGAAIRLHPAGGVLGVAEGIETALAARQLFDTPVWSCVSATGIESFGPPVGVRKLIVFGDNDVSGTGQAAAWALAKRLIVAGIEVEVRLPTRIDTDWADEITIPGTLAEPYPGRERTNDK